MIIKSDPSIEDCIDFENLTRFIWRDFELAVAFALHFLSQHWVLPKATSRGKFLELGEFSELWQGKDEGALFNEDNAGDFSKLWEDQVLLRQKYVLHLDGYLNQGFFLGVSEIVDAVSQQFYVLVDARIFVKVHLLMQTFRNQWAQLVQQVLILLV